GEQHTGPLFLEEGVARGGELRDVGPRVAHALRASTEARVLRGGRSVAKVVRAAARGAGAAVVLTEDAQRGGHPRRAKRLAEMREPGPCARSQGSRAPRLALLLSALGNVVVRSRPARTRRGRRCSPR